MLPEECTQHQARPRQELSLILNYPRSVYVEARTLMRHTFVVDDRRSCIIERRVGVADRQVVARLVVGCCAVLGGARFLIDLNLLRTTPTPQRTGTPQKQKCRTGRT